MVTDARSIRLRTSDTRMLLVSRSRTDFGDKALNAARPRIWNNLPTDLRRSDLSYKQLLFKTVAEAVVFGMWGQSAVNLPLMEL